MLSQTVTLNLVPTEAFVAEKLTAEGSTHIELSELPLPVELMTGKGPVDSVTDGGTTASDDDPVESVTDGGADASNDHG
jgi:hypothetical protein